jgi:hypothetical protein
MWFLLLVGGVAALTVLIIGFAVFQEERDDREAMSS